MYALLLCHRRSRRTGQRAFRAHWRGRRAALVAELGEGLGYESYVQLHRASRLNVLYLGILASRSWPLAALFSLMQGLPVPPLQRGSGRERWDVVEMFAYGSHAELARALTAQAGLSASARLAADALGWVRHSGAVLAEVVPFSAPPGPDWPRTMTMFFLRARPPSTRGTMLERWRTSHAELVQSLQNALGHRLYDQLHAREAEALASGLDALGVADTTFDGVAVLAHGSEREILGRLFNPGTQIANLRLVKDEANFIDLRRSALVFGDAFLLAGKETRPSASRK